jgi:CYTH domain-containing protein
MIELERTFLAKSLPANLQRHDCKEILDIYVPREQQHPTLRIRKNGDQYEVTKKEPVDDNPSRLREETVHITAREFAALSTVEGKRVHKLRYFYPYKAHILEFDVFQDQLAGLVLVDVEFSNDRDKEVFGLPEFCLADVTAEKFLAGGMLCGKSYSNIRPLLKRFDYRPLSL